MEVNIIMTDNKKVDLSEFEADLSAHESTVDADAAKAAEKAGVVDAAYVDYEPALKNYEGRKDVETLEDRRARENGTSFSEANFVREGKSEIAATTAAKTSTTSK